MEVGVVLAIIGCVVAQMLGGNGGLGYPLMAKMNAYETDGLFAVVLLLALYQPASWLTHRSFFRPSQRKTWMAGPARP